MADVRVRALYVPWLHGEALDFRVDAHRVTDARDQVAELGDFRAAQVNDLILRCIHGMGSLQAAHDPVHNVVHERVIAACGAIAVHRDRLAAQELSGKLVNGQIGSLARAVDGEEPQAVYRHVVQVMVRVRQQLARPIRRRRGRDRMMHRVLLRKRHDVVIAVHR